MNFKVSSTAFYSRLTAASKVMASKNSMPILDCFLLDVNGGTVTITASDSEKYFITTVPLVEQSGDARFCIPAKTIMESMKELAEQPLSIGYNPDTQEVKVVHNSGSFAVMAMDAAPYPVAKTVGEDATHIEMPASVLLNGINRCLFATANDEIRMVMNGVYVDIKPDCIVFAGTDGRKLVRNTNHTVKSGLTAGFILQKKVSSVLKAVLTKADENITIAFDSEKATVSSADMVMHFRLIEGRYPNYNAVIPENNPYSACVDRQALISALKRVSVFCNQSSSLVKLELANNNIKLTGQDSEYATRAEEFILCEYTSTPISIGFSCTFLLEIAGIMDCETLKVEVADPSRPGVIRPAEENSEDEVLMLLMPMRVED
ncbi:MAG: DNA polymerase III subunit beta [Prevotellaceae bacterium]|nr:DNA polymerase III subunit beta [Prevotellaceae bacterium]